MCVLIARPSFIYGSVHQPYFLRPKKQSVTLDLASIDNDDPDARTIFVSGLDWRVTEKELKEHFEVCGSIVRVTVLKDRYTQFSKGCAYIQVNDANVC